MTWREKLSEWLERGASYAETDAPKGWYVRGAAIAVLLAFPVGLWVMGHSDLSGGGVWSLRSCPPVAPIPRAELADHPLRFRDRFIWIVGRIYAMPKRCMALPCDGGASCCQPCQARLAIGAPPHQFVLGGLITRRRSRRVMCQGTSCKLDCRPFVLGGVYAVAGKPLLRSERKPDQPFARPSFRVRQLRIHRFCKLPAASSIYQRRRLPDPRRRGTSNTGREHRKER